MADKATVQEEIKKQGEIVRKLKAEKADKDLVGPHFILLEKFEVDYQSFVYKFYA